MPNSGFGSEKEEYKMTNENVSVAAENVVDNSNQTQPKAEVTESKVIEDGSEIEDESQTETPEENTEGEKVQKRKRPNGLRRKVAKLEAKLAQYEAKQNPVTEAPIIQEPKLGDYPDWDTFVKAQVKYEAKQIVQEELAQKESRSREVELNNNWQKNVHSVRQELPDYDEVIAEYDDVPVRPEILEMMRESDIGPKIAYHLAKNPDILESINKPGVGALSVARQLGIIEAYIKGGSQEKKPEVTKVTKSPAPISPVKKTASTSVDITKMSTEEYVAHRMQRYKKK